MGAVDILLRSCGMEYGVHGLTGESDSDRVCYSLQRCWTGTRHQHEALNGSPPLE